MRNRLTAAAVLALALFVLAGCGKKPVATEPFDPAKAFDEANRKLDKKYYEEARRDLEQVRRMDTELRYAPLAHLRIADSYMMSDQPEQAIEEYRKFIRDYPRHKYSSYAQHQIGIIYYQMIQGPDRGYGAAVRALEEFERLMSEYPRNPYRDSVLLKMERCRDVIADHEFYVGDFYFKKEAYNGALARLLDLLRDYPGYKSADEALYRIAVSYKGIGEDRKAEEFLGYLKEGYPDSRLVGKAEKEFARIEEDRAEAAQGD